MTLVTTARSVLRGSDPKAVPPWTQAIVFGSDKCARLGQIGRRTWYDWPDLRLELEEAGEMMDPNSPAIAAAPYFKVPQADGGAGRPRRSRGGRGRARSARTLTTVDIPVPSTLRPHP